MRLNEFIRSLHEAAPITVYHGTIARHARSILKTGMDPKPKPELRRWASDEHASQTSPSRASLDSSYWTSNLMTAMSSASNSAIKLIGSGWRDTNGLIVIAQIREQSALADEDSITARLGQAWAMMMKEVLGVVPDALQILCSVVYDGGSKQEKFIHDLIRTFTVHAHEFLRGSDRQPVPEKLLADYFWTELRRQYAHACQGQPGYYWPTSSMPEDQRPQPIPTGEAEQARLAGLDRLTRYYRKTAHRSPNDFSHTLRMDRTVGFGGSNRIIGMIEYPFIKRDPLKLVYGRMPEDFLQQWRKNVGPFPGLRDRSGTMLIEPDSIRESVETLNGVQFWKNPSVSALRGLAQRFGLRGLVLGPDLYVWDSHDLIHAQAYMRILSIPSSDDLTDSDYTAYTEGSFMMGRWDIMEPDAQESWFGEAYQIGPNSILIPPPGPPEQRHPLLKLLLRSAKLISSPEHLTEARYRYPSEQALGLEQVIDDHRWELIDWLVAPLSNPHLIHHPSAFALRRIEDAADANWTTPDQARAGLDQIDLARYLTRDDIRAYIDEFGDWDSYSNALIEPKRKETGWVVHFSEYADEIAQNGFLHGAKEDQLGLTRPGIWSDYRQRSNAEPGWNFGIPLRTKADLKIADYFADHGGYGRHAVVFRTRYTRILHHGDNHDQAIFWGPDIRDIIPIRNTGDQWTDGTNVGTFEEIVLGIIGGRS